MILVWFWYWVILSKLQWKRLDGIFSIFAHRRDTQYIHNGIGGKNVQVSGAGQTCSQQLAL